MNSIVWSGVVRFDVIEQTKDSYSVRKPVIASMQSGISREAFIKTLREQVLSGRCRHQFVNTVCTVLGKDMVSGTVISEDSVTLFDGDDQVIPLWFCQISGFHLESKVIQAHGISTLGTIRTQLNQLIEQAQKEHFPIAEFSPITITLLCIDWSTNKQISFESWNIPAS